MSNSLLEDVWTARQADYSNTNFGKIQKKM